MTACHVASSVAINIALSILCVVAIGHPGPLLEEQAVLTDASES